MGINKLFYIILVTFVLSLSTHANPVTEDTSLDLITVAGQSSGTIPAESEMVSVLSSTKLDKNVNPKSDSKTDKSLIKNILNFFRNIIGIDKKTNEPMDNPPTTGSSSQTESSPENLIEIPGVATPLTTGSSGIETGSVCPPKDSSTIRLKEDFTLPENADTITIIPEDGLTIKQIDKTWGDLLAETIARIVLIQQDKVTMALPENDTITLTPENFQIINGTTTESIDIKIVENEEQNEKTLFAYPKIGPLFSFGKKININDKKTTIKDGYGTFDLDLTTPDGATGTIKIKINLEKTTGSSGTENSINIKTDGNKVTLDGMNIAELHGTFVGSNLMVTSSLGEGKTGSTASTPNDYSSTGALIQTDVGDGNKWYYVSSISRSGSNPYAGQNTFAVTWESPLLPDSDWSAASYNNMLADIPKGKDAHFITNGNLKLPGNFIIRSAKDDSTKGSASISDATSDCSNPNKRCSITLSTSGLAEGYYYVTYESEDGISNSLSVKIGNPTDKGSSTLILKDAKTGNAKTLNWITKYVQSSGAWGSAEKGDINSYEWFNGNSNGISIGTSTSSVIYTLPSLGLKFEVDTDWKTYTKLKFNNGKTVNLQVDSGKIKITPSTTGDWGSGITATTTEGGVKISSGEAQIKLEITAEQVGTTSEEKSTPKIARSPKMIMDAITEGNTLIVMGDSDTKKSITSVCGQINEKGAAGYSPITLTETISGRSTGCPISEGGESIIFTDTEDNLRRFTEKCTFRPYIRDDQDVIICKQKTCVRVAGSYAQHTDLQRINQCIGKNAGDSCCTPPSNGECSNVWSPPEDVIIETDRDFSAWNCHYRVYQWRSCVPYNKNTCEYDLPTERRKDLIAEGDISGWSGIINCGSIIEEWYSTPYGIAGVKG